MSGHYTVAIVGAGIGAEHLRAYQSVPDRFTVRTLCDLDQARAEKLLESSPDTRYEKSLDNVLADPAIDIVDVCLPPHLHFATCASALKAGKHVVCEKPLVTSVRDADQLIVLSESTQRSVFPVFQYRFGLGALQLQTLIDAELTGTAYAATLETHWNRNADYYAVDWRGTWAGEQGGAVLNHAIHIHDWLSFVFGPVASVYAELATRVNDIEVEDCAALSIRMQSGALVTSSITLGAADDTSRLRFCFSGLTATSGTSPYKPAEDRWTFVAREPTSQSSVDSAIAGLQTPPAGFKGLICAIADNLDGVANRQVTLQDGRRSLEFVSAVYSSAKSGKPVQLPLTEEHSLYNGWVPSIA